MSSCVLVPVVFQLLITSAFAQPNYDWVPDGNDDAHITTLVTDDGGATIIGTDAGFRVRTGTATWQAFEEPGVQHRAVYAATAMLDWDAYLTGRLDADGHGYLELDIGGPTGAVVYGSTCGAFVELAGYDSQWTPGPIWACSRAGETAGELVVSTDHGQTWTQVPGHGHQDLYDLYCDFEYPTSIIVVGDAGIRATEDSGATWRHLSGGLPGVSVRRVQEDALWTDLPADKRPWPQPLWACTDGGLFRGLYDRETGTCEWEPNPLVAEPVRSIGFFYLGNGFGGALAVTDAGRVLLDFVAWHWVDITSELEGFDLLPVDVYCLLATADDGVWALADLLTAVDDLPPAIGLALQAAPNPFNPATLLRYAVPAGGHASLRVYDLAGRLVDTLLDAAVEPGPGEVVWQPRDLGAGVYMARLVAGESTITRKIALVR